MTVPGARVVHRSRRWQPLLALPAALLIALMAAELGSHSQTGGARAKAALLTLTPVLPNLDSRQVVITSHPSCDDYPPCTSAARTWSLPTGSPTFGALNQALAAWASRNHLGGNPQWFCGPLAGVFGGTGPGCQAAFTTGLPNQTVFVATSFTDHSALKFDPATIRRNGLAHPVTALGGSSLETVSVQVMQSKN